VTKFTVTLSVSNRGGGRQFVVGTKVSGISKTMIAKVSIPVLPEQTAIAVL
jgi:hypothetical protein